MGRKSLYTSGIDERSYEELNKVVIDKNTEEKHIVIEPFLGLTKITFLKSL